MDIDPQFEELVRQHMSAVYGYARRFTGNADTAADITQETFVKAWKNFKRFDKTKNFRAWLFTIAKRTAIDWLRKRADEALPDEVLDTAPAFTESLDMFQRTQALAMAVAQLPADYRAVIQLRLDDLQFHEISEKLQKPLNTVKSQYRRALILLRSTLKPLA
jgi:RNA polymerase sigma factor (sigma-70 family)